MMWSWGSGFGWGMTILGMLMMLLIWGGVLALGVLLVRNLTGPRTAQPDSAVETLRTRLAAGEITAEEFERIRKVLEGS